MMMKDDCEEFALNLCDSLLHHDAFKGDLDLRTTQLKLLFNLNVMDRLQTEVNIDIRSEYKASRIPMVPPNILIM